MLIKTYKAPGYNNVILNIPYKKMTLKVEFKSGNASANIPARLTTADPVYQYIIENSQEFGNMFFLESVSGEEEEDTVVEEPVKAEQKKKTQKVAKKASQDTADTVVDSVKDIADAIDYFSNHGIDCASPADVEAAMKSEHVAFPNLKR